jgi:hypothetical protein
MPVSIVFFFAIVAAGVVGLVAAGIAYVAQDRRRFVALVDDKAISSLAVGMKTKRKIASAVGNFVARAKERADTNS